MLSSDFAAVGFAMFIALRARKQRRAWDSRASEIKTLIGTLEANQHMSFSDASIQRALSFAPRPTDIFILTAPKTGTTWLQQICHQIRMRGCEDSMNFDDIYQVAPWVQMALDIGIDINAEQVADPRIFKTHQRLASIQRGGKYIVLVRDPAKTFISWFNFLKSKDVPPLRKYTRVSDFVFDEGFCTGSMRFGANLWEYYLEFWKCLHHPHVLVLVFEDLQKDLSAHVPLIAEFMGCLPLNASEADSVARKCGKDFMRENGSKFDESWVYTQMEKVGTVREIDSYAPAPRVTAGHTDIMDERATAHLQKMWDLHMKDTGCRSYEDFANQCRKVAGVIS